MFSGNKDVMPTAEQALPGRGQAILTEAVHQVNGHSLFPPFAPNLQKAMFGMGCFWGAEKRFWSLNGVYVTAVGYSAGFTPNATYQEVCSGATGHNEVVLVVYNPALITYSHLLTMFWQSHDPTQGMRQGNDRGTQYRSGIYTYTQEQMQLARRSLQAYQQALTADGYGAITTEIQECSPFYYAEDYHQQYLAKNPNGYCGLGGTGVVFTDSSPQ